MIVKELTPPEELSSTKTNSQPVIYGSEQRRFAEGILTCLVDTILVENLVHIGEYAGRTETTIVFNEEKVDGEILGQLKKHYERVYQELKEKYK